MLTGNDQGAAAKVAPAPNLDQLMCAFSVGLQTWDDIVHPQRHNARISKGELKS